MNGGHDPARSDAAWYHRHRGLRLKLALAVAAGALVVAVVIKLKDTMLTIDPGKGTPIGWSVRTDDHVATLIQQLEPYTPSLHRDHGRDTYRISLFVVALDGSGTKLVPLAEGLAPTAFQLAKVLGSDGRTLWYDVAGIGGVDLSTFERVQAGRGPEPGVPLQGAWPTPFPPGPDAFLCAGLLTGADTWLGLHSREEVERTFAPGRFVRRVERQEDAKRSRRLHRARLEAPVQDRYHRIITILPIGQEDLLNAAFLRVDDRSEPLRMKDPDGALIVYTAGPEALGTLMVARVDTAGAVLWTKDTAIDRFTLRQVLPGEGATVFVGTRPPQAGKVPEPLLVILRNATGELVTHSLWR